MLDRRPADSILTRAPLTGPPPPVSGASFLPGPAARSVKGARCAEAVAPTERGQASEPSVPTEAPNLIFFLRCDNVEGKVQAVIGLVAGSNAGDRLRHGALAIRTGRRTGIGCTVLASLPWGLEEAG